VNASLREAQDKLESLGRDVAAAQRLRSDALIVERRALQPAEAPQPVHGRGGARPAVRKGFQQPGAPLPGRCVSPGSPRRSL
jgi:hypothetical protein